MMDERISLSTLVSMLSLNTGDSKKDSEDFIRELFALVSEALERGESVKIKGLGVFKIINVEARKSVNVNNGSEHIIAAHRKVAFIPCKEIASIVNEPFEMFRTVELSEEAAKRIETELNRDGEYPDNVSDESESDEESIIAPSSEELQEEIKEDKQSEEGEDNLYMVAEESEVGEYPRIFDFEETPENSGAADEAEIIDNSVKSEEDITMEETAEAEDSDNNDELNYDAGYEQETDFAIHKPRNYYWFGVATGVLVTLIGVMLFWNLYGMKMESGTDKAKIDMTSKVDKVNTPGAEASLINDNDTITEADVPTKPSDLPEYDTITKTRYLTTMAKDHYGNYNLWPYIYIENEKILGHPDRIKPGTRVVVPPLSKYGVDPESPAEIEKAKQKGLEIYARYK